MQLKLHHLRIALESGDEAVRREWQALFGNWLQPASMPVDMHLRLHLTPQLPLLPSKPPFFQDTHPTQDGGGILAVYHQPGGNALLHYLDGALVQVPICPHPEPVAAGVLVAEAIQHGRFEDITYTSLAPLLRRRGYYLVHAFGASKNGRCALFVGPTGCGKTTTGLALVLRGWELLANDVVLLQERHGRIFALPTPGIVSMRPPTLTLLPQLHAVLAAHAPIYGPYNLTGDALGNGRWSAPCPVTHLYFPHIEQRPHTTLHHQNRAVALARLMSESMDRWDAETLPQHATILQKLVRQADAYALHAGQNMAQLAHLIEAQ